METSKTGSQERISPDPHGMEVRNLRKFEVQATERRLDSRLENISENTRPPSILPEQEVVALKMRKNISGGAGSAHVHIFEKGSQKFAGKFYGTSQKNVLLEQEFLVYKKVGLHNNIIRIHELADSADDSKVLLMDFVDGINGDALAGGLLAALENGHISYSEYCGAIQFIARRLLEVSAHCAKKDVVHCDFKPQNYMINREDGEPMVIDFGLAEDMKSVGLGTPIYKAPEQVDKKSPLSLSQGEIKSSDKKSIDLHVDEKTDPFGVGVTILSTFEPNAVEKLHGPLFSELTLYLSKLEAMQRETNPNVDPSIQLEEMTPLWNKLRPLLKKLSEVPGDKMPSENETAQFAGILIKELNDWLKNISKKYLQDDCVKQLGSRISSQASEVFPATIAYFKAGLMRPGTGRKAALDPKVFFDRSRAPNTGLIIDKDVKRDASGKPLRVSGIETIETDYTRFIAQTMDTRCTAREAMDLPFVEESIVDENRARKVLRDVVEKTLDGTVFKPKVTPNASRTAAHAPRVEPATGGADDNAGISREESDKAYGYDMSFAERKKALKMRLPTSAGEPKAPILGRVRRFERYVQAANEAKRAEKERRAADERRKASRRII